MNSYRLPARRPTRAPLDPIGYTTRRLSSLWVVAAAIGGFVVASLLDGARLPIPFTFAIGLVLFVGVATFATSVAARDATTASSDAPAGWFRGWGQSSQLGPDPEQVISRHTGART